MFHERLTAGAQRVLAELTRRTEAPSASTDYFHSLLLALFEGEGRAAELLHAAEIRLVDLELIPATSRPEGPLSLPDWQRRLIRRADSLAIDHSEDGLTGTEHLLLAAIELDELTAIRLENHGITASTLLNQISSSAPDLPVPDASRIKIEPAGPGALEEASLRRILDASANRCREGLRVVEDFVRFQLDDGFLSGQAKELRHELSYILSCLGQAGWVIHRDTLHDVGTRSSIASERFRGTIVDVLRASLKRVEEALRSLEEYGKLIDAELSTRLEQCRYRFYTIEKAVETGLRARERLRDRRLYLLVTDELCRYGAERTIRNVVTAGVDVVQIREKRLADRQLIDFSRRVRDWTAAAGVLLIINDRPDIAALISADGVHLGQDDLAVHEARRIIGAQGLIGVSTHSIEQAREAVLSGADYLGVGPVFPSQTKSFEVFPGLDFVRRATGEIALPWFAIGGINAANLQQVQSAGATRVAVSSAIAQAPHPKGVAGELAARLHRPPTVAGAHRTPPFSVSDPGSEPGLQPPPAG